MKEWSGLRPTRSFLQGMLILAGFMLFSSTGYAGAEAPTRLLTTADTNHLNTTAISSGVYGPFYSYHTPAIFFGGDTCWLVESSDQQFQVRCLPMKAISGVIIGQSSEKSIIQTQLKAVNGPEDSPIPEISLLMPLSAMDPRFFSTSHSHHLLETKSIFDDECKMSYQIDGSPSVEVDWLCSSFLLFGDKYSPDSKIYYELRVRPIALWPKALKGEDPGQQPWLDFFDNLIGKKTSRLKSL